MKLYAINLMIAYTYRSNKIELRINLTVKNYVTVTENY